MLAGCPETSCVGGRPAAVSGAGGKAAGGVQMIEGRQEWRSKACNGFWADDGTARVRCPAVHRSFCSGGSPCGALTPQTLEALAQERGRGSRSLFCDCNMRAGASVDEDAWGSDADGERVINCPQEQRTAVCACPRAAHPAHHWCAACPCRRWPVQATLLWMPRHSSGGRLKQHRILPSQSHPRHQKNQLQMRHRKRQHSTVRGVAARKASTQSA